MYSIPRIPLSWSYVVISTLELYGNCGLPESTFFSNLCSTNRGGLESTPTTSESVALFPITSTATTNTRMNSPSRIVVLSCSHIKSTCYILINICQNVSPPCLMSHSRIIC
ncbi:hypothetical protein NP493_1862g00003 [Ridgeia piscesae]|uniref:Uncharacterized protein n=1 Tax=Ridgeia piscesae TaxID=27915 RepID=A0AAD9N7B7_RIDPI|nr:hypothetical protein NP493_1862g00003 [Ridgeia piscesae]